MTDEEIMAALAEIEGWHNFGLSYYLTPSSAWPVEPLIRWRDFGPLMEKYRIDFEWIEGGWKALVYALDGSDDFLGRAFAPNPRRAGCMAIVKAFEVGFVGSGDG